MSYYDVTFWKAYSSITFPCQVSDFPVLLLLIYCLHTVAPNLRTLAPHFPWLLCPSARPSSRSDAVENLIKIFTYLYNFGSQAIQTGSKFTLPIHRSVSCLRPLLIIDISYRPMSITLYSFFSPEDWKFHVRILKYLYGISPFDLKEISLNLKEVSINREEMYPLLLLHVHYFVLLCPQLQLFI